MGALKKYRKFMLFLAIGFIYTLAYPMTAHAMHIMEGMLPPKWCIFWFVVSAPFFIYGLYRMHKIVNSDIPNAKVMLALCGAFVFVLSSLLLMLP